MNKWTINLMMALVLGLLLAAPERLPAGEVNELLDDQVSGYFRYRDRDEFMRAMAAYHGVAVRWTEAGKAHIGVVLSDVMPEAGHGRGQADPLSAIANHLPHGTPYLTLALREGGEGLEIQHLMLSPAGFMTTGDGTERIRIDGTRLKGSWTVENDDIPAGTYEVDLHFDLPLIDLGSL